MNRRFLLHCGALHPLPSEEQRDLLKRTQEWAQLVVARIPQVRKIRKEKRLQKNAR